VIADETGICEENAEAEMILRAGESEGMGAKEGKEVSLFWSLKKGGTEERKEKRKHE
jgi:hypothetical protein